MFIVANTKSFLIPCLPLGSSVYRVPTPWAKNFNVNLINKISRPFLSRRNTRCIDCCWTKRENDDFIWRIFKLFGIFDVKEIKEEKEKRENLWTKSDIIFVYYEMIKYSYPWVRTNDKSHLASIWSCRTFWSISLAPIGSWCPRYLFEHINTIRL